MKRIRILSFTVCLIFFSGLLVQGQEISYPENENASAFKLVVKGIDKIEGEIRIAVFNSEEKYTKDPVHAVVLPVDSTTIVWEQDSLPYGEYAIAVYHDKNTNGKIDTNFLGIPKEDYGFSNNARGRFGPASWKDSKFSVETSVYTTEIEIK